MLRTPFRELEAEDRACGSIHEMVQGYFRMQRKARVAASGLQRLRWWSPIGVLLLWILPSHGIAAQTAAARTYLPNLADEDWSFLRDPAEREDFFDPAKYVRLGRENRYLTIGVEARLTAQGFRIRPTAQTESTRDNYFLQRYLFSTDLRLNERFRVYSELQTGIINGRQGTVRPTDKNLTDVHQLFFEWRRPTAAGGAFGVRVGRQELTIGSSRMISASPGLNVKRSFDGARVAYARGGWTVLASVAKLVALRPGSFDDRWQNEETFWGVGVARDSPVFDQVRTTIYYLALDKKHAGYAQGVAHDVRHTVGVHLAGTGFRVDINYDGIWQWGTFGDGSVRAWAVSTDTGYRFRLWNRTARVGLRFDVASGDADAGDPDLESFNPFFPGSSFAGLVGFFGPTNLTDLNPAFIIPLIPELNVVFESPCYWRTSNGDGIYGTNINLLIPPTAGEGRAVGCNPGFVGVWQVSRHLSVTGALTRFLPGKFLDQTFVSEGFGFYSVATVFRF